MAGNAIHAALPQRHPGRRCNPDAGDRLRPDRAHVLQPPQGLRRTRTQQSHAAGVASHRGSTDPAPRPVQGADDDPCWRLDQAPGATLLMVVAGGAAQAESTPATPPEVGIVEAVKRPITESREFLGRIEAINRVNLVARVMHY